MKPTQLRGHDARWTRLLCVLVSLVPTVAGAAQTAERAHAIGVDAYTYFYSLVTMDLTRRQLTNAPADSPGLAALPNTFRNVPAYPTAEMHSVVRPKR